MVLNISHEDKEKYKKSIEERKPRVRKKRTSLLSDKSKSKAFQQYDKMTGNEVKSDPEIDAHVKMNDNFMRTGPYSPKKK
jgi:hypothetical protein